MSNWKPTNTLRLARLAHPGREWTIQSDLWATARVERDLSGDVWIGFNADSLDDLAKVEKVVQDRGFGLDLACLAAQILIDGQPILSAMPDEQLFPGLLMMPPDQRRRALIAVIDASPEIEKQ